MKVSLKKETNIIDVPEDAASLVDILSEGFYRYRVTYRADPRRVISNKAISVKIQASKRPSLHRPTKLLTGFNTDEVIRNLLQKSAITKDVGRSQKSDVFFTYMSDISAKIPNDKTNVLSFDSNPVISTETVLKLKPVSEISKENIVMPVLENNISTALVPDVQRNPVVAKAVSDKLVLQGVDPAAISGTRTRTIQSAKKVSGGLVAQPTVIPRVLNETEKVSLFGGLVNTINPSLNTQLRLTDLVNVLVNQPRTTIDIVEDLDIPIGLLQLDDFYLILTLVDKSGIEIQSLNISIPHSKNLAQLQIPVLPPKIEVLQTGLPGKNIIQVKQVDTNASGISLYRKEVKTGIPVVDAAFTFIGNIDCTAEQDFQRVEDNVNNFSPVLYRAIPYNDNNIFSAEFAAAGSKALKPFGKRRVLKRKNFASLTGLIVNEGISLEVRDIPAGVCLVRLLKRDATIFEQTFTLAGQPTFMSNEETTAPIFITDTQVKPNRTYEYRLELVYVDGDVEVGTNNLVITFNPITANIVDTSMSTPVVIQNGLELDAQFTLESSLIPTELDAVRQALESQGLGQYYSDAIAEERQNLQNIIAYGIQRTNLTTGEVEDFGVITSKTFSDRQLGKVKGVKPLVNGFEYRYTITTFFRAAETTLRTVERTVETGMSSSYVLQPARWRHPVTLLYGNLVTQTSLERNHAKTTFSFGKVGNVVSANISLAAIVPSVIEAKAQKLQKFSTLIQWRVQGNVQKIDHFLIIMEILGMRTIVGKCHNISETNYFQFVDKLDDGEHGQLKYYIVPVYYDFSRGTEVGTNEVLV